MVSFPRLNVSSLPPGNVMALLSASEGRSWVVNTALHLLQLRRRHTDGLFLCGLELATAVEG